MQGMKPENQILNALGFRYVSQSEIDENPVLKALLGGLGTAPLSYARTDALGLGYTLARDEASRLCAVKNQFDLDFFKFKEGPQLRTRPRYRE